MEGVSEGGDLSTEYVFEGLFLLFHLVSINCRFSHSCLAQFYLRNALQENLKGATVLLSQCTINDPYYKTLLEITSQNADVIFISVYIWNHTLVKRLIVDVTASMPAVSVVLGGPQAGSLGRLPGRCTVVQGEIEGISEKFYADLEQNTLQLRYQASAGKKFPSPYTKADYKGPLKNRQLYYESSRGCPFFCSYCLSSLSRGVRHKPLDLVYQEIDEIIASGPMIIKFVDRTFNDNPERALAIWQYLQHHKEVVKCHFEIAPDRFTEEMFTFLSTVDCDHFQFEIGIQSFHGKTLEAVNRQMDRVTTEKNIQRLAEYDTIHLHVDLILGLPYESRQTFRDSFCRVFACRPHYIQLGLLKVLPNTEMAARATEYGLVFCAEPPYEILATRWLDHDEIRDLYEFCECVESFYNNRFFRSLWQYLADSTESPFDFFYKLLQVCREHDFFHRAATHPFMARILWTFCTNRPDHTITCDLLAYDWLRCGHRKLPDYMHAEHQKEIRNELRQTLPQNFPGVFDYTSRVEFLKQSSYLRLSAHASSVLKLSSADGCTVAFLPRQTAGVMKHCQCLVVQEGTHEHT